MLTVILLVTRPAHGDTSATGAGEIIQGAPGLHTWAVTLIAVISAVIGSITNPAGGIAQGRPLTRQERHPLHPQAEVAATVSGATIHLIGCIFTVQKLVATAGITDAAPIPASELICSTGGLVTWDFI